LLPSCEYQRRDLGKDKRFDRYQKGKMKNETTQRDEDEIKQVNKRHPAEAREGSVCVEYIHRFLKEREEKKIRRT